MRRVATLPVIVLWILSCRSVPPEPGREEGLPPAARAENEPPPPAAAHLPVTAVEPPLPAPPQPAPAPPEPVPLPDPQAELAEACLQRLTLEQKIGQRFITWFPGPELSERARRLVREGYVGGILLFADNVQSRGQLQRLTAGLQELAAGNDPPIGLLIGIDQEGGRVNRLRLDSVTRFPPARDWGERGDPQFVEAAAYVLNREIRDLGCNLNLAPVLDLYTPPDDAVIGDRSLGIDPRQVGSLGLAYLAGARRAGVATVAKHFPGHGATTVDSHRDLPVVEVGAEELLARDALPFRMAVEGGADALMTAHILYPRLDARYPATLSRPILQGLLRERLGYRGVVVSDGIGMGALLNHFSIEEVLRGCLEAGVDLILEHSRYDTLRLQETVLKLVRQGVIEESRIDEGARRVLLWKARYGLLPAGLLSDRPPPGPARQATAGAAGGGAAGGGAGGSGAEEEKDDGRKASR